MTKPLSWRYMQLLLPQEHISELSPHERAMFVEFCDMFWQDNVRVIAPMRPPGTHTIQSRAWQLPLCKMYPADQQTGYLRS